MNPLVPLAKALQSRSVRFALIGVGGANQYALAGQDSFVTNDNDLFLPLDPDNLVRAWAACEEVGLDLWLGDEPLDKPRDRWLADRIVERRMLTRVTGPNELQVDLTLVMKGFEFDMVWSQRRQFIVEGVEVPTARLLHIVQSKHAAGRDKDKLFLATHQDALDQLLKRHDK